MSSKNTPNAKAADNNVETAETEASVPQQATTEKVTILKGRDGEKDSIVITEVPVEDSFKDKFLRTIRNKKVLAGLGAVAGIALIALVKGLASSDVDEDDVIITTEKDDEGNITSVTVSNPDTE